MNEYRGLWRGKCVDNKEWATGYYMKIVRKTYSIKEIIRHCIFTGVEFWDKLSGETALECYKIDPSTLGECTGLTDKNGKLAFESDLVRDNSNGAIGVIKYGEYRQPFNDDESTKHIGFYIDWLEKTVKLFLRVDLGYWLPLVEIVGNIHDNPELLQKGAADNFYDVNESFGETLKPTVTESFEERGLIKF